MIYDIQNLISDSENNIHFWSSIISLSLSAASSIISSYIFINFIDQKSERNQWQRRNRERMWKTEETHEGMKWWSQCMLNHPLQGHKKRRSHITHNSKIHELQNHKAMIVGLNFWLIQDVLGIKASNLNTRFSFPQDNNLDINK